MKLKFNFNSDIVLCGRKRNFAFFSSPLDSAKFFRIDFFMSDAISDSLPADNRLSLAQLPAGARARVLAVTGTGAVARRLMEMGVVPGVPVRMIKSAPLGDPLEVRVRGYHLAVRRAEAQTIKVVTSDE